MACSHSLSPYFSFPALKGQKRNGKGIEEKLSSIHTQAHSQDCSTPSSADEKFSSPGEFLLEGAVSLTLKEVRLYLAVQVRMVRCAAHSRILSSLRSDRDTLSPSQQ